MQKVDGRYHVYGNPVSRSHSRAADRWQQMFVRKFDHDPNERYALRVEDNPYLGDHLGLKNIVRVDAGGAGSSADTTSSAGAGSSGGGDLTGIVDDGVLVSTVRMGFGHYRIAMAGASAARAMGFTPY